MKRLNLNVDGVGFCWFVIFGLLVVCSSQDFDQASSSMAPMEKNEQEALYFAIQGFIGQGWNGSDLYPDPCGWTPIQGVSCDLFDGLWYVTIISIGPILDNSLSCSNDAKFTNHLFKLKHLKSLSIYNCFNSVKNPATIPVSGWEPFSNTMESLEFRSNPGLVGTVPDSVACLNQLQSLVFLENGLEGNLPQRIGSLVKLKRLVLAGNRFIGEVPSSYGGLSQLLIFDASRNSLSGALPDSIGALNSLLKLDLSSNRLNGPLPEEIGTLKNLSLLDLSGNNISGGLIQQLQEMHSLEEMVLSNNPIHGDLTRIQWKNLQSLEILNLSNTSLTGKIPDDLTGLKNLRFLGLNNNNLSGFLPPGFAMMPNISSLYINSNNISGILEFPDRFYARMGRRFGASNNPNLCYRVESGSLDHVPYGVKPCQEEITTPGNSVEQNLIQN